MKNQNRKVAVTQNAVTAILQSMDSLFQKSSRPHQGGNNRRGIPPLGAKIAEGPYVGKVGLFALNQRDFNPVMDEDQMIPCGSVIQVLAIRTKSKTLSKGKEQQTSVNRVALYRLDSIGQVGIRSAFNLNDEGMVRSESRAIVSAAESAALTWVQSLMYGDMAPGLYSRKFQKPFRHATVGFKRRPESFLNAAENDMFEFRGNPPTINAVEPYWGVCGDQVPVELQEQIETGQLRGDTIPASSWQHHASSKWNELIPASKPHGLEIRYKYLHLFTAADIWLTRGSKDDVQKFIEGSSASIKALALSAFKEWNYTDQETQDRMGAVEESASMFGRYCRLRDENKEVKIYRVLDQEVQSKETFEALKQVALRGVDGYPSQIIEASIPQTRFPDVLNSTTLKQFLGK